MGFRDDRDALRAQRDALRDENERLARELEETSRQLSAQESKDVEDEVELARLRAEVDRLRAEIGPDVREKNGKAGAWALSIAAAVIVVGGVGLTAFFLSAAPPPEPTPEDSVVSPLTVREPEPDRAWSPTDVALFGAVVVEAQGMDVRQGDGCVLSVDVGAGLSVRAVRITCARQLYDSGMPGDAEADGALTERTVGPSRHVHRLRYVDPGGASREGAPTPRPRLLANTLDGELRLFRSGDDEPLSAIVLVERESTPRVGPALGDATSVPEPLAAPSEELVERLENASAAPCNLDGAWTGQLHAPEGVVRATVRAMTRSTSVTIVNGRTVARSESESNRVLQAQMAAPEPVTIELDCDAGTGAFVTASGVRWEGHLGPGHATLLGRVEGRGPFWLRRDRASARDASSASTAARPTVDVAIDQLPAEARDAVRQALGKRP